MLLSLRFVISAVEKAWQNFCAIHNEKAKSIGAEIQSYIAFYNKKQNRAQTILRLDFTTIDVHGRLLKKNSVNKATFSFRLRFSDLDPMSILIRTLFLFSKSTKLVV